MTKTSLPHGYAVTLNDTDAASVNRALLEMPGNEGETGLVFTMVVVCTSRTLSKAIDAAVEAGREHPSRILVAVQSSAKATKLDAELRASIDVPGSIVILRMSGDLIEHRASVVVPLLLADLPVVVWWPGESPAAPATDELGRLGTRRITDVAAHPEPIRRLGELARNHEPGCTDLSWPRITRWRGLLANALDQVEADVETAVVESGASSVPAELMAAWLESRLGIQAERTTATRRGAIRITLNTTKGDVILGHDGVGEALLSVPGQADRPVVLDLRDPQQLLAEELRRLDVDPVFDSVMATVLARHERGAR